MGDRAALEGAVIHDGDDEDLGGVGDTSYVSPGRTSGAEPQKLLSKGECVRLRVFMHACTILEIKIFRYVYMYISG